MTSEAVRALLERVATLRSFNLGQGAERVPADQVLEVLCTRRLDHTEFPVMEVETSYVKSRPDGAVVFDAIVAVGGHDADGDYEALGFDVGDSEDPVFWLRVFLALRARGLAGVTTVVSEEHGGLVDALAYVFPEARWEAQAVSTDGPSLSRLDGER